MLAALAELPLDGLQLAGNALMPFHDVSDAGSIAARLVVLLGERGWEGDTELAAALEGQPCELHALASDLKDLGEALRQSNASEAFRDLVTGQVWPGAVIGGGMGPDGADLEDTTRWLLVSELGPGESRRDMRDFAHTIDRPGLRDRLLDALEGRGGHRRFLDTLRGHGDDFTRWHRFRDGRALGRARGWLADAGCQPAGG